MPTWSTLATQRPRGTRGTQGRLQGPIDASRGASTRNKSTRGMSAFEVGCSTGTRIASEQRSEQR